MPGRLLQEAARDASTAHAFLDGPLRQGLLPAKLSAESFARQWGVIWLAADIVAQRALLGLLRARARLQAAVSQLLAAREASRREASNQQAAKQLQVRAALSRVMTQHS